MRLGIGRGKGDEVMPHDLLCEEKGGGRRKRLRRLMFLCDVHTDLRRVSDRIPSSDLVADAKVCQTSKAGK
jgi:hypothetical protein